MYTLDIFNKQPVVLAVLAGALGLQVWHVSDVYARTSPYFDGTVPALAASGAVAMELFILIFTENDRKKEPKYFCALSILLNIVYHFPALSQWLPDVTDPMQVAGRLLSSSGIPLAVYYCSDLLRSMRKSRPESEPQAKPLDFAPVLERIQSLHSEHVKDMASVTAVLEGLDQNQSELRADLEAVGPALDRLLTRIESLESAKEAALPFACADCGRRFATKNALNPHKCKPATAAIEA